MFKLIPASIISLALVPSAGTSQSLSGFDNLKTPGIDEGAIGSGFDNLNTPGIDEGAIGSGFDNLNTPGIDEGAFGSDW